MTDGLVERVARAIAREAYSTCGMERVTDPYTPDADYWNALSRTAIAIALEEAAQVAEAKAEEWATQWREDLKCDSHLEGKSDGADDVAAAIRAMIKEKNDE
jgi:hypothetical protein